MLERAANTIRALSIDAVNQANSGHPGAPMGMADLAAVLWTEFLRFDPNAPDWMDRDRFVLSNGHASMLLYSVLHLAGYDLSIEEIKNFRQMGSKTPGHPESHLTPGVETTTGPLGQGFANAVGLALAERMAKARFKAQDGFQPIGHRVFTFCGDGCLMEGITHEAASWAGHLQLGELVVVYDDNQISIDGSTSLTFTEDVQARFQAYGWHTLRTDGHDHDAIREAYKAAIEETGRPTLIIAKTHIGYGSPNRQDTKKAHGEPLGAEEAAATKEKLGWTLPPFEVPDDVKALFNKAAERGAAERAAWQTKLAAYEKTDAGSAWNTYFDVSKRRPADVYKHLVEALSGKHDATRKLSAVAIDTLAAHMPSLVGGSADLTGSTKTFIDDGGVADREDFAGRNLHYGVREHAMAAAVNGMALYGGFVPFGATFLTFSDYCKNSLRLAALMRIRALTVFTHDSIGLGEDGPTHQAVEHLWALRLIPGYLVWRPADALETAMAWSYAAGEGPERPMSLVFSRQKPPAFTSPEMDPKDIWKGAYVVSEAKDAQVTLVGTGTETGLCVQAAEKLASLGVKVRVVSMPCVELYLEQDAQTQQAILPKGLPVVTVEAGSTGPWASVRGQAPGLHLGVDSFGESAPYEEVYAHFGLTPDSICKRVQDWLPEVTA